MKKKTVAVKKEVDLHLTYILRVFKGVRLVSSKTFLEKPTDEDIAEFIEHEKADYCICEERYHTKEIVPDDSSDDEDDDWDEDDWDV